MLRWLSNGPGRQVAAGHTVLKIDDTLRHLQSVLDPLRRPSLPVGAVAAFVYLGGVRVEVPCIVDRWAPAVYIVTDSAMAKAAGYPGPQFMLGSVQAYGALIADNLAAYYRSEIL